MRQQSLLPMFVVVVALAYTMGCALDPSWQWYHAETGRWVPERPRDTSLYDGTGTVVVVRLTPRNYIRARIDYASHQLPVAGDRMLLIRTNSVVGRARAVTDGHWVWVTDGRPEVGDVVIGVQHEKEIAGANERKVPTTNFMDQTR